jgi:hypothetical protein
VTIDNAMAVTFRLDRDGWVRHPNSGRVRTRIPVPALMIRLHDELTELGR